MSTEERIKWLREALIRIAGTPTKNSDETAHACAKGAMDALRADAAAKRSRPWCQ